MGFSALFLPRYQEIYLSIFSLSFVATATAGVMCRFIRLLVVVVVDLSWYGWMYVWWISGWVGFV